MKKSFFILFFIFSIYWLQAQDQIQVYKFKAFQTSIYKTLLKRADEISWDNTDILVVINIEKNKIKIFAKKNVNLDTIQTYKAQVDDNGNDQLWHDAIKPPYSDPFINLSGYQDRLPLEKG
jgi:hypothetical protein